MFSKTKTKVEQKEITIGFTKVVLLYNAWVYFHILKLLGGLFRSPDSGQSQYSPARKVTNKFVIISNGEDGYAAPSAKLRN